jgi:hypothetical protein
LNYNNCNNTVTTLHILEKSAKGPISY